MREVGDLKILKKERKKLQRKTEKNKNKRENQNLEEANVLDVYKKSISKSVIA